MEPRIEFVILVLAGMASGAYILILGYQRTRRDEGRNFWVWQALGTCVVVVCYLTAFTIFSPFTEEAKEAVRKSDQSICRFYSEYLRDYVWTPVLLIGIGLVKDIYSFRLRSKRKVRALPIQILDFTNFYGTYAGTAYAVGLWIALVQASFTCR